jgi:TolB-like protein/DNA-binding winged helix-turn-helix (wHTH) protein
MKNGHHKSFSFDEFHLATDLEILRRGEAEIHLAKRPYEVLLFLIENRERIVNRDELLDRFWNGHEVYDDALRKCVGAIRKSLDDTEKSPRFIATRRGSGYRFIAPVVEEDRIAVTNGNGHARLPDGGPNGHGADQMPDTGGAKVHTAPQLHLSAYRKWPFYLAASALALTSIALIWFFGLWQGNRSGNSLEASAARHSIAILPLRNLTGDASNDYLSNGISESLINELSRIDSLKVISRSSSFQFKDQDVSAQEIGERLGVETILEGGLRRSGDELRVDVRLVDTKDGSVMWAIDSRQTKFADILTIQDGITCQIISELKVRLCGEVAPSAVYTQNVDAYQLYLKGSYFRNLITTDNLEKARGYFEDALRVDPDYAPSHEGLATVYMLMEFNSAVPPGTAAPKAEFHAQKALNLDADLAGAYLVLGAVKTSRNYDLQTRENYYRQAILKNPNFRTAHLWLANNLTAEGRFEEAEREILRAQELDPLSPGVRMNLTELYYYWRKPDRSIEQARLMVAVDPDNKGINRFLAKAYAQKGDLDNAFAAMQDLSSDDGARVLILAAAGRTDEARQIVETIAASSDADKNPYWVGSLYAAIGNKEKAFDWLERSFSLRQADLVSLKIDPAVDSLREDERYADLLRRINLAN